MCDPSVVSNGVTRRSGGFVLTGGTDDAGARVVELFADAVLDAPFFLLLEIPALYLCADTAHVVNRQGRGRFGGLPRRRAGGRSWLARRGWRRRLSRNRPTLGQP